MIHRVDALPAALQERLSGDDDPALWEQVLKAVAEDAATLDSIADGSRVYAHVGVCSHWFRPHQMRWTAAGGFACPVGYGEGSGAGRRSLPRFDWSVQLRFDSTGIGWDAVAESRTKHFRSIRVAIPSRTMRHRQAAVRTVWSRGTLDPRGARTVFYGFRAVAGVWELKACSKAAS